MSTSQVEWIITDEKVKLPETIDFNDFVEFATLTSPYWVEGRDRGLIGYLSVKGAADRLAKVKIDHLSGQWSINIDLFEGAAGRQKWLPAHTFPDLPTYTVDPTGMQFSILDVLEFVEASLVFCSGPGFVGEDGLSLSSGWNLLALVRPIGPSAELISQLSKGPLERSLRGTVGRLDSQSRSKLSGKKAQATNETAEIMLELDVGLQADFGGGIRLNKSALQIWTPLSRDATPGKSTLIKDKSQLTLSPTITIFSSLLIENVAAPIVLEGRLDLSRQVVTLAATGKLTLEDVGRTIGKEKFNDLIQGFPSALETALRSIELQRFDLTLGLEKDRLAIKRLAITAGIDQEWQLNSALRLTGLSAKALIHDPLGHAQMDMEINGVVTLAGAKFDICVQMPDYGATAQLQYGSSLSLRALCDEFLSNSISVPDIFVDGMELEVGPGKRMAFSAEMSDDHTWSILIGPVALIISDVFVEVVVDADGSRSGNIQGILNFDETTFIEVDYELPNHISLRGSLPEFSLRRLIGRFDANLAAKIPATADIEFNKTELVVEELENGFRFAAATKIRDFGTLMFVAQKRSSWGVAAGVALPYGLEPAIRRWKFLQPLAPFVKFAGLEQMMLTISSLPLSRVQFPSAAHIGLEEVEAHDDVSRSDLKLPDVAGFCLFAKIDIASNKVLRAVGRWLNLDASGSLVASIVVSMPDPSLASALAIEVNKSNVNHITELDAKLGGRLRNGDVEAFLSGQLATMIDGQGVKFDLDLAVEANGILVTGVMIGTLLYDGWRVANAAIIVGLDWEGIPSVGVSCHVMVGTSAFAGTILFDSVSPKHSALIASTSELSFETIISDIAGAVLPELAVLKFLKLSSTEAFSCPYRECLSTLTNGDFDALRGLFSSQANLLLAEERKDLLLHPVHGEETWYLHDLASETAYTLRRDGEKMRVEWQPQIYIVPYSVTIGKRSLEQGLRVMGNLEYLFIRINAQIDVAPGKGIVIKEHLDKIVLIDDSIFSITDASGQKGAAFSLASYTTYDVELGRQRPPHCTANGKLRVLGMTLTDVDFDLKADGLHFASETSILWLDTSILGRYGGGEDLCVAMQLKYGIPDHVFGLTTVDVEGSGTITVEVEEGEVTGRLRLTFQIGSRYLSLPELRVTGNDLADLPGLISRQLSLAVKILYDNVTKGAVDVASAIANFIKGIF